MANLLTAIFLLSFILMIAGHLLENEKFWLTFKIVTSFTLIIFSVYNCIKYHCPEVNYFVLLPFAMFFGLIGDLTLGLKNFKGLEKKVKDKLLLSGFLSFFIGHIFYAVVFYKTLNLKLAILAAALALIMFVTVIVFDKLKLMDYGSFKIPCMIYGYLLAFIVISLLVNSIISGGLIIRMFIIMLY